MSDGPHRSLPLRRHWKKFTERVETPSFSAAEMADALRCALITEFKEAPVSRIGKILIGEGQISFLQRNCAHLLEEVRGTCWGSSVATTLIDCAIEADANGLTGDVSVQTALMNSLESCARGNFRSIVEHYQRKVPQRMINVRDRLSAAYRQISFSSLASEIMSGDAGGRGKYAIIKHSGIDEGPQL